MPEKTQHYPIKPSILLFVSLFWAAASIRVRAQSDSTHSDPKWVLDFGGSIGLFAPFRQVDDKRFLIGVSSTTSVQFNYKKHLFFRLEVGDVSAGFRYKAVAGPVNSDINSTTNSINVGLGLGYQYKVKKWQPFVYAGSGPSLVFVPATVYDVSTNTLDYKTNSAIKMHWNAGAGVNYYLSKSVILLLEAKTFTVTNLPKNPSPNLSGISVLVNIKITL